LATELPEAIADVLEAMPDGIVIGDLEGRIVLVNLDPRSGNLTEVGESRTAGGRPYHGIGGSRVRGSWPERAD